MTGTLFIISAPCGAGKTSLATAVFEELRHDWPIEQVITYTTRKPRQHERNGYDYYFLDSNDFECRIKDGFFLEWSNAYTAYYGSPRSIIEEMKKGRSFIMILDRAGAARVIETVPDAVLIWIELSSMVELKERLLRRGTESPEQLEWRLQQSHHEMILERDHPLYHYKIINDDFGTAKLRLLTIVMQKLGVNVK